MVPFVGILQYNNYNYVCYLSRKGLIQSASFLAIFTSGIAFHITCNIYTHECILRSWECLPFCIFYHTVTQVLSQYDIESITDEIDTKYE